MSDSVHFYEPEQGHRLTLDPRVIGWISSRSRAGDVNLAPYSFFGAFSSEPKIIGFSSEGYKDTVRNIEETGEFVWNMTSRALAEAMNRSAAPVAPGVNEFELAGLKPVPGRKVKVPHVEESPASLECKLLQVLQLRGLDGKHTGNWVVFGQVVGVHIRREFLGDGLFDLQAAQPVMRAGYRGDYVGMGEVFGMIRPLA